LSAKSFDFVAQRRCRFVIFFLHRFAQIFRERFHAITQRQSLLRAGR